MSGPNAPAALGALVDQPRVRDFLTTALADDRLSHAYLFVGPPGSGKHEAAEALAKCVVCPNGGDGTCDECRRVAHRTHPDVRWLAPGSATGYLVSQVRELIEDAGLAPIRSQVKVYVLERAELLRGSAANALLKTLEEPPANTMFILCGRVVDAMLPTIVSRCQQVPFRAGSTTSGVRAVMRSYQNGYATVVDTQERRGGPHVNGHNNATFFHIMVVDSYNEESDGVQIVDPGAGVLWPGGSQKFWYYSLKDFVSTYMQNEVYGDRQYIGVHYAR